MKLRPDDLSPPRFGVDGFPDAAALRALRLAPLDP
jgi:hypothetical protein